MKILIIDDDPCSLKLASDVLQACGHAVMLATAADQAILSIKACKPDAIVLDLRLPAIKGLAVARQCRESVSLDDVPIIAVTAFPASYGRADAVEAGCDLYLVKPIDTRSLADGIESAVAARVRSHSNPLSLCVS